MLDCGEGGTGDGRREGGGRGEEGAGGEPGARFCETKEAAKLGRASGEHAGEKSRPSNRVAVCVLRKAAVWC